MSVFRNHAEAVSFAKRMQKMYDLPEDAILQKYENGEKHPDELCGIIYSGKGVNFIAPSTMRVHMEYPTQQMLNWLSEAGRVPLYFDHSPASVFGEAWIDRHGTVYVEPNGFGLVLIERAGIVGTSVRYTIRLGSGGTPSSAQLHEISLTGGPRHQDAILTYKNNKAFTTWLQKAKYANVQNTMNDSCVQNVTPYDLFSDSFITVCNSADRETTHSSSSSFLSPSSSSQTQLELPTLSRTLNYFLFDNTHITDPIITVSHSTSCDTIPIQEFEIHNSKFIKTSEVTMEASTSGSTGPNNSSVAVQNNASNMDTDNGASPAQGNTASLTETSTTGNSGNAVPSDARPAEVTPTQAMNELGKSLVDTAVSRAATHDIQEAIVRVRNAKNMEDFLSALGDNTITRKARLLHQNEVQVKNSTIDELQALNRELKERDQERLNQDIEQVKAELQNLKESERIPESTFDLNMELLQNSPSHKSLGKVNKVIKTNNELWEMFNKSHKPNNTESMDTNDQQNPATKMRGVVEAMETEHVAQEESEVAEVANSIFFKSGGIQMSEPSSSSSLEDRVKSNVSVMFELMNSNQPLDY